MTMAKSKDVPTKSNVTPKPSRDSGIPQDELKEFLSDKITKEDWPKVKKIRAGSLWDDWYRLNIWVEEYREGSLYPKVWIGYSYFILYENGIIIDKTNEPTLKKGK
jgi:hypothetical protein